MSGVNTDQQKDIKLQQRDQELTFARDCLARFTYAISHEIHSPLGTLNNLLDMLGNEHRDQLDTAGNELLDMILLSARRTQSMVSGILEYSSCAAPLDEKTNVDTRALIDEILLEMDPVLQKTAAIVDIGNLPVFKTSETGMRHIFTQLISNALKFTLDDSPPKLSINAQQDQAGVEFIVSDKGIGIDLEYHESIFDLFSRLHARSEFDGDGLGLSMALQVVQALEGRIWVTQGEHGGSAFHVYLPRIP